MSRFLVAHGAHADVTQAVAQAAAQVDAQAARLSAGFVPTLGIVYLGDPLGAQATAALDELHRRWPGVAWAGCTGIGVIAGGAELFGEPELALMLSDLPAGQFALFSGRRPLDAQRAFSALVHADPALPCSRTTARRGRATTSLASSSTSWTRRSTSTPAPRSWPVSSFGWGSTSS